MHSKSAILIVHQFRTGFLQINNKDDKSALNELEAWIYFIGSDRPEDMETIIHAYPKFAEMYEEIYRFRKKPEEAVSMFSEALRIMDENTVKLMIEQQKEEIKQLADIIEQQDATLAENKQELADKNQKIADLQAEIERLRIKK